MQSLDLIVIGSGSGLKVSSEAATAMSAPLTTDADGYGPNHDGLEDAGRRHAQ